MKEESSAINPGPSASSSAGKAAPSNNSSLTKRPCNEKDAASSPPKRPRQLPTTMGHESFVKDIVAKFDFESTSSQGSSSSAGSLSRPGFASHSSSDSSSPKISSSNSDRDVEHSTNDESRDKSESTETPNAEPDKMFCDLTIRAAQKSSAWETFLAGSASINITKDKLTMHHAIAISSDQDCMTFLIQHVASEPTMESATKSIDRLGNTILHIAACTLKPRAVEWIVNSAVGDQLRVMRNHGGYTPLEALQSKLEVTMAEMTVAMGDTMLIMSDKFLGFGDDDVSCLVKLQSLQSPSYEQIARFKYGCTCGECLEGFFSPRMLHAFLCQAKITYDMLNEDVHAFSGKGWHKWHFEKLEHLPSNVSASLRTNYVMRKGFTNVYQLIAECLNAKQVPNITNILTAYRAAGGSRSYTRIYIEGGGTFSAVLCSIMDYIMDQDDMIGDGSHENAFGDEIAKLKKCRNDRAFFFVRRSCCDGGENPKEGYDMAQPPRSNVFPFTWSRSML
ncbi:MAG: hypothetical protein M1827_004513 [Pycnora praestabilis]|nr:MAG: hypothetical protein M1827_004513 [Pycnora praestabilis]